MFERLKALLQHSSARPDDVTAELAVPMAAAMLLLEVAWADQKISDTELDATRKAIESMFHLAPEQVQHLVERARAQHDTEISMYPFTRAANDALSMDEKRQLIESLWRLAGADSGGEPHEEYTIRRIADLLYVSHQDFIAAKLAARGAR
jgi:uncharacterized tellurite resistance protein B-like protein